MPDRAERPWQVGYLAPGSTALEPILVPTADFPTATEWYRFAVVRLRDMGFCGAVILVHRLTGRVWRSTDLCEE